MSPQPLGDRRSPSAIVFTAFLNKLAKHLALLACLAIVGQATGRVALGQRSILLLVVGAAVIDVLGRTLKRRWRHPATYYRDST